MNVVDVFLVFGKDKHGRRRFLQHFEKVRHLAVLAHVLDFLDNVEARGARAADVDRDGVHEGRLGKVLDLRGHRR